MAKWGEGDPRWIVEERPDATNVNNWHWSEKNASIWSKDKLKQLLVNLKIDEPGLGVAKITEVTTIEGEAIANNRKAKLIFFYEWVINAKWKGTMYGKDEEVKGKIEIPNLSEENEPDEVDVNVTLDDSSFEGDILKEMMRNKGTQMIRAQLATYIRQLKEDFAKDLILPTAEGSTTKTVAKEPSKVIINNGTVGKPVTSAKDEKQEMKTLILKEEMKCRASEMFKALTDPEMVAAFSRGAVTVDPRPTGCFSMFDGNVTGHFTVLEANKLIKQKWRFKSWPEGHYSAVTLELDEKNDHTVVNLTQTGIPAMDFERTENGWKRFYFQSMKQVFGFGSMLY